MLRLASGTGHTQRLAVEHALRREDINETSMLLLN
jgi:hypothetical protein